MEISFDLSDGLARIAFDDGKKNAVTLDALDALEAAMDEAEAKAEAVVIIGRPGSFCAGFDMAGMLGGDPDTPVKLGLGGGRVARRLFAFPGPTAAACTGHAFTVGVLWLLGCDARIGESGPFKLSMTEVKLGVPLDGWPLPLLRARVPATELQQVVIQSKTFSPEESIAAGFLDEVVAVGEAERRALERLEELRALPAKAYAATKRALRSAVVAEMDAGLKR